jgi:hypothetical protein
MWQSQDAEDQQNHAFETNSSSGGVSSGGMGKAGAAGGQLLGPAAAPSSAASHGAAQDCSWERDAVNAAVAAGVVLEELARDVQLQVCAHAAQLQAMLHCATPFPAATLHCWSRALLVLAKGDGVAVNRAAWHADGCVCTCWCLPLCLLCPAG